MSQEKKVLIIKGNDDQETVEEILYKNGYTVRRAAIMPKGTKTKAKELEYWEEEDK